MIIIGGYLIITFGLTTKCPQQKIIYKKVEMHPLDIQFSEQNKPSKVFSNLFSNPNVYIGGYSLDIGKTYIQEQKQT